jgi:predicted Fe-Mo cluster-binding NifX family protein
MPVIAIPVESDGKTLAGHFGRCPIFVVATVESGAVKEKKAVENPHYEQHMPFAVPDFLAGLEPKPDIIITTGLGPRAIEALNSSGIDVIYGVVGTVDEVLQKYIDKTLETSANICHHV